MLYVFESNLLIDLLKHYRPFPSAKSTQLDSNIQHLTLTEVLNGTSFLYTIINTEKEMNNMTNKDSINKILSRLESVRNEIESIRRDLKFILEKEGN